MGEKPGEAEAGDAERRRTAGGSAGGILSGCDHVSEAEENSGGKDWTIIVKKNSGR